MRGASAWDVRAGAGDPRLAQLRTLRHLGPRLFPKVARGRRPVEFIQTLRGNNCLLYTSDAADDM
eukprot:1547142-Prymnesium_polylepis.1